jgi:hypothetical protein
MKRTRFLALGLVVLVAALWFVLADPRDRDAPAATEVSEFFDSLVGLLTKIVLPNHQKQRWFYG